VQVVESIATVGYSLESMTNAEHVSNNAVSGLHDEGYFGGVEHAWELYLSDPDTYIEAVIGIAGAGAIGKVSKFSKIDKNLDVDTKKTNFAEGYNRNADGSVTGPRGGKYQPTGTLDAYGNPIYINNGKYHTFNDKNIRISAPSKKFNLSEVDPPKGKSYEGVVHRYEYPERIDTTWDQHKGNIASDHRYTGSGEGGVYAGTTRQTALKEIDYYGDLEGRVPVSREVKLNNVLDLTDPKIRKQLRVNLEDIAGDSYSKTSQIGRWAKEKGYDGILAPSARDKGGSNIVQLNND